MANRLMLWIARVFGRARVERDLSDEIAFHLRERTDYWRRQGFSAREAARRARIEFGGVEGYKEACRQALGLRLIDELRADVGYGLRSMRVAPASTAVSVAILAIAIGANSAVFSVLETVMLQPLPVERPQELRELAWIERADSRWQISYDGSMRSAVGGVRIATSFAYPVYAQVRDRSTAFADLFLFERAEINAAVGGRRQRAAGLLVSGNFLTGLGVKPIIGRALDAADDTPGAPAVVVLTHGLWQRLFAGDRDATLGRVLTVNGTAAVVVGVTPPEFYGVEPGSPIDVIMPITTLRPAVDATRDVFTDPRYWGFRVMGRVKPETDERQVQAETEALVQQAVTDHLTAGQSSGLARVVIGPGGQGLDSLRHNYGRPLYLLMAIMAVVLLIACANIAGLLLTRAAAREREMGLRLALGAGRGRLLRQVLTESMMLAGLGGSWGLGLALLIRNELLPLLNQDEVAIDISVGRGPWLVAFSVAICLLVGVMCGILPALRAARLGPGALLKRTLPGGAPGSTRLFAGKTLIAVQVALSLVLVVGAALFTRTLVNLRSQALGFRPDHLLLFQLDATAAGYKDAPLLDVYDRVLQAVQGLPGVRSVSLSRYGLISGGATRDTIVVPDAGAGRIEIGAHVHYVSPRYLETMAIPLLAGREITARDREAAPRVALVNEALARLLPGGGMPVGRRILYDQPDLDIEIVGMAADARFASLRDPVPPTLYLPYRQYGQQRMTFAVRVEGDPASFATPLRSAIDGIDGSLPVFDVRTQEAQIDGAVRQERVFAYAALAFAALALFLACLGIYGTLTYSVARRTAEIGLRMALGAGRWSVAAMVMRESLVPVLVGAVFGMAAALAGTRFLQGMLFGLTPHDAPTLAFASLALTVTALLAAWLPCRRASGVDPMAALRSE